MELFSEYFNKKHLLSSIDARVKIIVALFTLILVLSYKGFLFPLVIILICAALCKIIKVHTKVLLLRYAEPAFIALILVLLKFFFSGTEPLIEIDLRIFALTAYKDGLYEGLLLAARILAAVSVVITLGFATPFTEIMAGLSWFRVPKTLIEITMFAYRYIFILLEDAMVIYNAQKNRLGYSSIKRGLSSFSTLAGSLIIKAFDHSQKITVSMVQRGYEGDIPFLSQKPFKANEIIFSILFLTSLGIIWKI